MSQITIDLPDDALPPLKASPGTVGNTLRMTAAAEIYERGHL